MIQTLWDDILFQSRLRPGGLAVYGPAGPVPYGRLVHDADTLATELMEQGVTRDDMVGLHFGYSYLHVLLIVALDRLGIPSMSLAATDRGALPVVLPQYGLTAIVAGAAAPPSPPCRWIVIAEPDRAKAGAVDAARLAALDSPPDAFVRLCWSSGTTGGMKGSPLSRRVQAHRIASRRLLRGMGPHTRYFTGMPLGSAAGYGSTVAALAAGGAVILPNPGTDVVALMNALGVTLTNGPPSVLAELMRRPDRLARPLPALECFEALGAHLPTAVAREALGCLTPHVWCVYGATESDRIAHAEAAVCLAEPNAVGYVTPGVEAEIVDDGDRRRSAGQEGLLRVRGPQVIDAYYNDEAATRRNFRDGWFYPGDIGMITSNGLLRITSRVEDVIRQDGTAVSPLPIEEAMRGLPGVRDVAVFALARGSGDDICAALVLDPGADVARIRTDAAARLGAQAPARLFVIDKLPRNANGKIQRRELVAMAERSVKA